MRFTMARPEISCHPELLLDGAKTLIAGALCYYRDAPEPAVDEGRLPRYTWRDEYADLRGRLGELGRRLGGSHRVLVDESEHVDRAGAVRAGIAFYGKNTMAITRRHGSWVVLGVLVTDVEIEPRRRWSSTAASAGSASTRAPRALWTTPARSMRRSACRTGRRRQRRYPMPTARSWAMVYGCDICQEVCPWNRGVEKRRRGGRRRRERVVSLADWLERDGVDLVAEFDRLYVPRNDERWLRRNALVAAGTSGARRSHRASLGTSTIPTRS